MTTYTYYLLRAIIHISIIDYRSCDDYYDKYHSDNEHHKDKIIKPVTTHILSLVDYKKVCAKAQRIGTIAIFCPNDIIIC